MNQIYVSGPWSFASGVLQVVKSIKAKSKDKVVYSEKGGFTLSDVGNVYLKGEAFVDPLDYLNIEVQPTSYFY
jgi:hypothetical protein